MRRTSDNQNLLRIIDRYASGFDGRNLLVEIQQRHIVVGFRPGDAIVGGSDFLVRTMNEHLFEMYYVCDGFQNKSILLCLCL